MTVYERFADKGYHSSLATTFGIDFEAYENMVLSRLRAAGCRNNLILVDQHMLSRALSDDLRLPEWAGTYYTVCGVGAVGVFHPKLLLQLGHEGGRALIGSGNLTAPGIAGNLEIASIVECSSEASPERDVVRQCWEYFKRHLDPDDEAQRLQIRWMLARTPWLESASAGPEPVSMADGSRLGLLASDPERSILSRFVEQIRGPVKRLIVISPYWDRQLAALAALDKTLSPRAIAVVIDPKTGGFPKQSIAAFSNLKLHNRTGFHGNRFIHAKLIIAESDAADYVLSGSTNCTFAALGNDRKAGINEEASLFRQCPPGEIVPRLGLDKHLDESRLVDPHSLPDWAGDESPLDDIPERQAPGQFLLTADTITWIPSAQFNEPGRYRVHLYDRTGSLLASDLDRLGGFTSSSQRLRVPGLSDRPAFARAIDRDESASLPGVICDREQLLLAIREPHSRRTEKLMDQLAMETDANPLIQDILEELLKLDADEAGTPAMKGSASSTEETPEGQEEKYRSLSYSEFISRRRPHDDKGRNRTSLAGSNAAHVYGFLDRLLGLDARKAWAETSDSEKHIGDALAVKEESDSEFDDAPPDRLADEAAAIRHREQEETKKRRLRRQDRATREKLVRSCMTFIDHATKQSQAVGLDTKDFLRLRLLLMVVLDSARSPKDSESDSMAQDHSRQLLKADGDEDTWPRMIGRLLFCVFGGNKPAISGARLLDDHDQLPDDLIKCWATCYWCLQACMSAPVSRSTRERDATRFKKIADQAYRLTLPSRGELLSKKVTTVMDAMSARYSLPLGIEGNQIRSGHESLVVQLFSDRPRDE